MYGLPIFQANQYSYGRHVMAIILSDGPHRVSSRIFHALHMACCHSVSQEMTFSAFVVTDVAVMTWIATALAATDLVIFLAQ